MGYFEVFFGEFTLSKMGGASGARIPGQRGFTAPICEGFQSSLSWEPGRIPKTPC